MLVVDPRSALEWRVPQGPKALLVPLPPSTRTPGHSACSRGRLPAGAVACPFRFLLSFGPPPPL